MSSFNNSFYGRSPFRSSFPSADELRAINSDDDEDGVRPSFGQRLLTDMRETVLGIPAGLFEIGKSVGHDAIMGATGFQVDPGKDEGFKSDDLGKGIAKGFWETSFLPSLIMADYGEAWDRASERPFSAALDAASLASFGAGTGAKALAKAGIAPEGSMKLAGYTKVTDTLDDLSDASKGLSVKDKLAAIGEGHANPTMAGYLKTADALSRKIMEQRGIRSVESDAGHTAKLYSGGKKSFQVVGEDLYARPNKRLITNTGKKTVAEQKLIDDHPFDSELDLMDRRYSTRRRSSNELAAKVGDKVEEYWEQFMPANNWLSNRKRITRSDNKRLNKIIMGASVFDRAELDEAVEKQRASFLEKNKELAEKYDEARSELVVAYNAEVSKGVKSQELDSTKWKPLNIDDVPQDLFDAMTRIYNEGFDSIDDFRGSVSQTFSPEALEISKGSLGNAEFFMSQSHKNMADQLWQVVNDDSLSDGARAEFKGIHDSLVSRYEKKFNAQKPVATFRDEADDVNLFEDAGIEDVDRPKNYRVVDVSDESYFPIRSLNPDDFVPDSGDRVQMARRYNDKLSDFLEDYFDSNRQYEGKLRELKELEDNIDNTPSDILRAGRSSIVRDDHALKIVERVLGREALDAAFNSEEITNVFNILRAVKNDDNFLNMAAASVGRMADVDATRKSVIEPNIDRSSRFYGRDSSPRSMHNALVQYGKNGATESLDDNPFSYAGETAGRVNPFRYFLGNHDRRLSADLDQIANTQMNFYKNQYITNGVVNDSARVSAREVAEMEKRGELILAKKRGIGRVTDEVPWVAIAADDPIVDQGVRVAASMESLLDFFDDHEWGSTSNQLRHLMSTSPDAEDIATLINIRENISPQRFREHGEKYSFGETDGKLVKGNMADSKVMIIPRDVYNSMVDNVIASRRTLDSLSGNFDKATGIWTNLMLHGRPRWMLNNAIGSMMLIAIGSGPRAAVDRMFNGKSAARLRGILGAESRFGEKLPMNKLGNEHDVDSVVQSLIPEVAHGQAREAGEMTRGLKGDNRVSKMWNAWTNWVVEFNDKNVDNPWRVQSAQSKLDDWIKHIEDIDPDAFGDVGKLQKYEQLLNGEVIAKHGDDAISVPNFMVRDSVIDSVFSDMIDYSNLSPKEKKYIRRLFPFWSWMKGSSMVGARTLVDKPLTVQALGGISQAGLDATEEEYPYLPNFLRGGIPVGGRLIGTGGMNPLETPLDTATMVANLLGAGNASYGAENPVASMNPFLKVPLEVLTRRDTYFGVPLSQSENAGKLMLKRFVGQVPQVKALSAPFGEQAANSTTVHSRVAPGVGLFTPYPREIREEMALKRWLEEQREQGYLPKAVR